MLVIKCQPAECELTYRTPLAGIYLCRVGCDHGLFDSYTGAVWYKSGPVWPEASPRMFTHRGQTYCIDLCGNQLVLMHCCRVYNVVCR